MPHPYVLLTFYQDPSGGRCVNGDSAGTFRVDLTGLLPSRAAVQNPISNIVISVRKTGAGGPSVATVSGYLYAAHTNGTPFEVAESPLLSGIVPATNEHSANPAIAVMRFRNVQFRRPGNFKLGVSLYRINMGSSENMGNFTLNESDSTIEVLG